jgi:quinol monooxygenase YgiN
MPVFKLARFEVRPEARADAERAMHDFAGYVRTQLTGSSWTTYRDPSSPTHYFSVITAEDAAAAERHRVAPGTEAFDAALQPLVVGDVERTDCELVTSSDLQRRHVPDRAQKRPRRR